MTSKSHPAPDAEPQWVLDLIPNAHAFALDWLRQDYDPNVNSDWRNLARAFVRLHRLSTTPIRPDLDEMDRAALIAEVRRLEGERAKYQRLYEGASKLCNARLKETVAAEADKAALTERLERAEGGWLPIVLCPTDGTWRLCKLPDGSEVVATFDGYSLSPHARQWRVKTFLHHTSSRQTGEKRGGVEQFSAPFDTFVIGSLPSGVYPTHFRPNDTVHGVADAPKTEGGEGNG